MNLQMAPSTVQETVTVTGESPLIDGRSAPSSGQHRSETVGGLPLNGRNWMDPTMLAAGARKNLSATRPAGAGTSSSISTARK